MLEVVLERDVLEVGHDVDVGSRAGFGESGLVNHDVDSGVLTNEVDDGVERHRLLEGHRDRHLELAKNLEIGFRAGFARIDAGATLGAVPDLLIEDERIRVVHEGHRGAFNVVEALEVSPVLNFLKVFVERDLTAELRKTAGGARTRKK